MAAAVLILVLTATLLPPGSHQISAAGEISETMYENSHTGAGAVSMSATSTDSDVYRTVGSSFTTGNNRTGYTLTAITVHAGSFEDYMDQDQMTLALHRASGTVPGAKLHTLAKTSRNGEELRFEPARATRLGPNRAFWVVAGAEAGAFTVTAETADNDGGIWDWNANADMRAREASHTRWVDADTSRNGLRFKLLG